MLGKYRLGCPVPMVRQESSVSSAGPAVEQKGLRASVSRPEPEGLREPASLFLGSRKTSPKFPVPPPVPLEPCVPLSPSYLWRSRSAPRWPRHSTARPQRTTTAAQPTSRRSLPGPQCPLSPACEKEVGRRSPPPR